MSSNPVKVGICGLGTVGSGTFNVLHRNAQAISARAQSALDVIHVGVSKEEVGIEEIRLLDHDLLAEQPDSRPGIDDHSLLSASNLETSGIPTVFHGIRARAGDTPACAPKLELK